MENESQLRSTVNAAVRANVAFYPIDARGLVALPPGGDASKASARGTGLFSGGQQTKQKDRFTNQQETLSTLAQDTGGKALLDDNDLAMGIVQAQQDIRSYYILGYYSTNGAQDGKYRKVTLALNGTARAGLKLDYRSGYFGSKDFSKFSSDDKERQLEEALLEITGLDAITLQPAAGAHGELTGILLVRAYLEGQGSPRKRILTPD